MSQNISEQRPIRVGVFADVRAAEKAVQDLRMAGFTAAEVTIVCSDEEKVQSLRVFEHQHPAGNNVPAATAAGTAIGAAFGGLSAAAGAFVFGTDLLATGGAAVWTGGVLGGFIGAMSQRGVEKELANFYQQAIQDGKILLAAEAHGDDAAARLQLAASILADAGAEPMSLPEG